MKPTAYLINTGRGALVDEPALIRALKEEWIAGAGLDVYAEEPPPRDCELFRLDNCVLSPHCGSGAIESIQQTSMLAVENLLMALRGERCPLALNPEVYDSPALRAPLL
jgi:glyoxylate reductase